MQATFFLDFLKRRACEHPLQEVEVERGLMPSKANVDRWSAVAWVQ